MLIEIKDHWMSEEMGREGHRSRLYPRVWLEEGIWEAFERKEA